MNYYCQFLGLEEYPTEKKTICTPFRDNPFSNNYYPIIISHFNQRQIASVSPKYYSEFVSFLGKKLIITSTDMHLFIVQSPDNLSIRNFERYECIIYPSSNLENIRCVKKNEDPSLNKLFDRNNYKVLFVYEEAEIMAYAAISDIFYGAANIVVMTQKCHRNKGLGKCVTAAAIKWCYENNLVASYFVEVNNLASLKIANHFQMKKIADEIIVTKYI